MLIAVRTLSITSLVSRTYSSLSSAMAEGTAGERSTAAELVRIPVAMEMASSRRVVERDASVVEAVMMEGLHGMRGMEVVGVVRRGEGAMVAPLWLSESRAQRLI